MRRAVWLAECESLVIDQGIRVEVLEILDDHIRLGITDPEAEPEYWEETLRVEPWPAETDRDPLNFATSQDYAGSESLGW